MKKLFTIIVISAIAVFPQQLRQVLSQSYTAPSAVYFVDQNTGWMTGLYEAVYKTTDGGVTWVNQGLVTGSSYTYYTNQFLSTTTGFIAGGKGTQALMKKTTDGGTSWTEITVPIPYAIKDIYFRNEQTGWVLASETDTASIHKTTDGGNTWTQVVFDAQGDLEALDMLPSGKGVAVGGRVGIMNLYYTSDGDTWTKAPVPSLGGFTYSRIDVHAVHYVSDNFIYAVGWGSSVGAQPSILLRSTDGGATWTYMTQAPENRTYQNLNGVYFKDEMNGLAFGGGSYEGTIILKTTDGGTNWTWLESGMGFTSDGCYGSGDIVYVVGGEGNVAKTTDFGNSFELLTPVPGSSLRSINVVNNTVFTTGFNGVFFKSTDKGNSWDCGYAATGRICTNVNGMHFINESTGFLARSYRHVTKTSDGGETWTEVINDTNITGMVNEGVFFLDENNGFVAGRTASNVDVIYKTTDGGLNWTASGPTANENLNHIVFSGTSNGVAAGNDNKILYTTDGGATWQAAVHDIPAGTEVEMKAAAFITPSRVIAVGEKSYLISENSGANWKYYTIPGFTGTLDGVAFKSADEGIAVGSKSIFKTTDSGLSWTNINDTLITGNTTFYDAAYDQSGDIWVVGGGSKIFTTSPFIGINDPVYAPAEFSLAQNYPNPFNPSTTIRFSVASEVKVNLRVYDILGNLVSELMNGNKPAGEYQVEFNASNLSSGVYFCVMNAGGRLFTTKMSLIK